MDSTFATYNLGKDWDWKCLIDRLKKENFPFLPKIDSVCCISSREPVILSYLNDIISLGTDILCLQEVGNSYDPKSDIKRLQDTLPINFSLAYPPVSNTILNTVIVFNKEVYTYVPKSCKYSLFVPDSPWAPGKPRYLSVDLMHNDSMKVIRVCSAHLTGFNLSEPEQLTRKRGFLYQREIGDVELTSIVAALEKEAGKIDAIALGIDANTSPEIHKKRLDILRKKGFVRVEEDTKETCYNPHLKKHIRVDYLFFKTLKKNRGEAIELSEESWEDPRKYLDNPLFNPSDHIPVIRRFSLS